MPVVSLNEDLEQVDTKTPESINIAEKLALSETKVTLFGSSTDDELIFRGMTKNGLINAIIYAYNNHIGLRITPDDILHCFAMVVSRCLNDNAEEFRDVFVNHEGKKELVIKSATECKWDNILLDAMNDKIDANIKTKLDLVPDFSTSTNITKNTGRIMKMASVKEYFSYGFMFGCGVPYVDICGTDNDWVKLLNMIDSTSKVFTQKGYMVNWFKHFRNVVCNLIDTTKGLVDEVFWSKIVTYVPYGSGDQKYISGWVQVLVPGSKYNDFPTELNILNNSLPPNDHKSLSEWAQVYSDIPHCETVIEAKLNDNGVEHNMTIVAGHLGYTIKDGFTIPHLGYYAYY